jgi:imidazolonepropionase-like amidohydrolase
MLVAESVIEMTRSLTLVSASQVLLGPQGQAIRDGAVLVSGERIVAVGAREDLLARAEPADELAFGEASVLPGLINAHVHLAFDASATPTARIQDESDSAALALMMAGHARQLLDVGVTTARDLGDRDSLVVLVRNAITDGLIPGPRILSAATPITSPGGHCWYLGGQVGTLDQIREQVRANAETGADWIKVMASGGQTTSGVAAMSRSQFTAAELTVLVDEAHSLGLPVAAHAHGLASIASSIQAGVDTIEHCTFLAGPGQFEPSEDLAAQMVARNIAVCPGSSGNWRALARVIGEERAYAMVGRTKWLADRGVRVVPGTDAGLSAFTDFPDALIRYLEFGFNPEQIIAAATAEAAVALKLSEITGRLEPGLAADLLVVNGDPHADVTVLREPLLVMARGKIHLPTGQLPKPAAPARAMLDSPTGGP